MIASRFLAFLISLLLHGPAAGQTSPILDAGTRVLQEVTGATARQFSTQDFGRAVFPKGRSVLVPEARAERLLAELRTKLPAGLIAFVGVTNSHATPKPAGVELVVAEGKDQFDILRVAATDGINYDLTTEDLIKELRSWDRDFGIDIWQAETDTVQLRLKSKPRNVQAFANRVFRFCPDIVDQGVGNVTELAKWISKEGAVYLWWD